MTTIRQLFQMNPTNANELFTKLGDTSADAVKTRKRLFGALKAELELLTNLEEKHLFPVLRKHKKIKAQVREAFARNKAVRKLLARVENTPLNTEEFVARVEGLRKMFQQYMRDKKNDFLPVFLEALTDEESKDVVQHFEMQRVEVEEAKRAEANERRAEARHEREMHLAEQAKLEDARRTETQHCRAVERKERRVEKPMQVMPEIAVIEVGTTPTAAHRSAAEPDEALSENVAAISRLASDGREQAEHVFVSMQQKKHEIVSKASKNLQEITALCIDASRKRWETSLAGIEAVLASRSLPELFDAQTTLFRMHVKLTFAAQS